MSRNDDYTTENLLDYLCHQTYKLTGIDFLRQTNLTIPQQINFVGKLEEEDSRAMFLLVESNKKLFSIFL